MYSIKGFIENTLLTDNQPGFDSVFGELSTYARTFSRNISTHSNLVSNNLSLVCFSAKNDAGENFILGSGDSNHILQVIKWLYDNSTLPNAPTLKNDVCVNIQNQFQGFLGDVQCGDIVTSITYRMPKWISWTKVDSPDKKIKIWLNGASFEQDYDEYEIVVVPPFSSVDVFFQPVSAVKTQLAGLSIQTLIERAQNSIARSPETIMTIQTIDYVNPQNPQDLTPTNWFISIYGPKGNSPEKIKAAIITFITQFTTGTINQWKAIFPDLFRLTQIIILPLWTKMAIPNRETYAGIYSPISNVKANLTYAKTKLPSLSSLHVDTNLEVTHHKYRSITLLCVGGSDNANNKYKLSDFMPDYIGELSSTQDFNRMSQTTKDWSALMETCIMHAESNTSIALLPVNLQRTTIDGIDYVGFNHNKVYYFVAVK